MALKALMLRKKISDKKKALEGLRSAAAVFEQREVELESAIDEANTDEERSAVEEEINQFEADRNENQEQVGALEREIEELETELQELENQQNTEPVQNDQPENNQRSEVPQMSQRTKFFGMTVQERDAFFAREDVKTFLGQVRQAMKEQRAISGVGYLIPEIMLGLLRENIENYSVLYKHVFVRRLSGTGRMVVMGAIPEAVWTEMCANLNELDLSFGPGIEVDGFKVGGYFRICNPLLQDADIDLANELLTALGQAIGFALDKAILFGTGTKMPTGIVTTLSAVSGTPNIISHAASVTDLKLFQAIVKDAGIADSKYTTSGMVWVMNKKTKTELISQAMSINAAGAIVTGLGNQMPVIGGTIEELNLIPENVIIAGHFDMYLLAERRGIELGTSEHAFWVADQTGFRGTARYDGKVIDANAFVAIGINGTTPSASGITFAADTANETEGNG